MRIDVSTSSAPPPEVVPLPMELNAFGGRWGSTPCEVKFKVSPTSLQKLDECTHALVSHHFHLVQSIPANKEAIAAVHAPQYPQVIGLIHVKLRSAGFIEVTVRSTDQGFAQHLQTILKQILQ